MRAVIVSLAVLLVPSALMAQPPGKLDGNCCGQKCKMKQIPAGQAVEPTKSIERGMSASEHNNIHSLLSGHASITRKVEEIPGGVKTTTTTKVPEQVATLRAHVRQMSRRLEEGRPVRIWAPIFRGVFEHHSEIKMEIKDIEAGVEVTETTKNAEVVPLIRAHAMKVNEFASKGHAAARPPWAGRGRGMMSLGK